MEHKIIHWFAFGAILLLLLGIFYSMGAKDITVTTNVVNKISVSGDAETEVMPDEVVIRLSVVTEGKEAESVQNENANKMNAVMEALKKVGIKEDEIETTGYNLYPWKEYDYNLRKQIDKGYRLSQTITLTTSDVDKTGEYLSVAVKNGINQVDNVNFQLSDELENQVKDALVAEATTNAKEKAKTLAENLEIKVGKAISVSETNYNVPRYYAGGFDETAEMAVMSDSVSKLNAENVEVTLRINVDFAIV
ncbi:SIMPL domain-containing protein [Candidatus Woesearchaeota archaeon]|nr:SIMPL domain-containing protein [Candidatus Woesearchaeota archaeon]